MNKYRVHHHKRRLKFAFIFTVSLAVLTILSFWLNLTSLGQENTNKVGVATEEPPLKTPPEAANTTTFIIVAVIVVLVILGFILLPRFWAKKGRT